MPDTMDVVRRSLSLVVITLMLAVAASAVEHIKNTKVQGQGHEQLENRR